MNRQHLGRDRTGGNAHSEGSGMMMTTAEAQANVAENGAVLALAAVSPPDRLESHMAEAERRAEVIAASWRTSLGSTSKGVETPLAAGLRSVYEDVAAGRLL